MGVDSVDQIFACRTNTSGTVSVVSECRLTIDFYKRRDQKGRAPTVEQP
jgi:hypothetical protein